MRIKTFIKFENINET